MFLIKEDVKYTKNIFKIHKERNVKKLNNMDPGINHTG